MWHLPPSKRPPVIWADVKAWNMLFLRSFHPYQRVLMEDGRLLKMKDAIAERLEAHREETKR